MRQGKELTVFGVKNGDKNGWTKIDVKPNKEAAT